jgi:hypothetical protein
MVINAVFFSVIVIFFSSTTLLGKVVAVPLLISVIFSGCSGYRMVKRNLRKFDLLGLVSLFVPWIILFVAIAFNFH